MAAAFLLAGAAMSSMAGAESLGFRNEAALVHEAKTAYDNKYTNIQWNTEAAENVGAPIAYAESVLVPIGSSIFRYAEENGFKEAEIKLPEQVCDGYSGVMSGTTLIQPTQSGICTVDFTTAEITSHRSFDGNVDSDVAVIDDMAYFSVKKGEDETFYCVELSAELPVLWEYTAQADITSPTVQGDFVIFGAGDKLITAHYTDGSIVEISVGDFITSTPFASQYAVFFTTEGGNTIKLRLNDDGTMEEDTLVTCETGAHSSAPLAHNNRLYVTSESGLHILDSINMERIKLLPDIASGSDPFLTRGNGPRIYTVAPYEGGRWALYCVYDPGEDVEPQTEILAVMENYEGGRSAVSDAGTMYFRDGIGRVYALTAVGYNIVTIIIRLVIMVLLIAGVFLWIRMVGKRRAANDYRY